MISEKSSVQVDSSLEPSIEKKRDRPARLSTNDYFGNACGMFQVAASVVETSVAATFHSPYSATPVPTTKVFIVPTAGLQTMSFVC